MTQYLLENKQLRIKVKASPIFIRSILYTISFLCFLTPILGVIGSMIVDDEVKIGKVSLIVAIFLSGFYMLRVSLWNHYGEEIIQFSDKQISYLPDYRWFKGGRIILDRSEVIYSIKNVGYESDNKGVLVISNGISEIESVVEIPIDELEKIIERLKNEY